MTLMQWGPLQFEVTPLNFHEYDHSTATDWARKEIAGAPYYREWVGEGEEEVFLRGRVFPHSLGGLSHLNVMDSMRQAGHADQLVRGDGEVLGWFIITNLQRGHKFIGADGVGQQIDFEALFVRVPAPDSTNYFPGLYQLTV